MKKLFEFLVDGCWHHWETRSKNVLTRYDGAIGTRYECTCSKCGTWRKFDLIAPK